MKFIRFDQETPYVARLTVNRPEVRNALNWKAMEEFSEVIDRIEQDKEIRVLLIGGEGKAFISGADLDLVAELDSPEDGERLASTIGEALAKLRRLPVLTIAMIDGPARGGGAEIAVSCDLRFMSSSASIGFVHASLGLIPGWGGARRLFDLVGYSKALEYLSSAESISADEALQAGLANRVISDELFDKGVSCFVERVTNNGWKAIKSLKDLLLKWEGEGQEDRRFAERALFLEMWNRDERREKFAWIKKSR